jgi:hypothetical protein
MKIGSKFWNIKKRFIVDNSTILVAATAIIPARIETNVVVVLCQMLLWYERDKGVCLDFNG